jgi:hypothetical protein
MDAYDQAGNYNLRCIISENGGVQMRAATKDKKTDKDKKKDSKTPSK